MKTSTRFFLFLSIFVIVVVSGIWIWGGKKHEYVAKLLIDRQPQQVFSYLTQPDSLMQWVSGLKSVEELSPAKGAASRAEKTQRVVKETSGNQTHFQDQVIRFEQDELLTVQSTNGTEIITSIFQLEPTAGKTQLTYRVKIEYVGFGRLLAPFQKHELESKIETEAIKLKKLVEQNEPKLESPQPIYQNPNFS